MFQIGDIVQLKSDRPKMTVHRVIGHQSDNTRIAMEEKY